MSIPWAGCSHQHVVRLAGTVATFLSPVVLCALVHKIVQVARRGRGQTEIYCHCFSRLNQGQHGQHLRYAVAERREAQPNLDLSKERVSQDTSLDSVPVQAEDQQDLLEYGPCQHPVEELYCNCDSVADRFEETKKISHDGEGGDCQEVPRMEAFSIWQNPGDEAATLEDQVVKLIKDKELREHNCESEDRAIKAKDQLQDPESCGGLDEIPRHQSNLPSDPVTSENSTVQTRKETSSSLETESVWKDQASSGQTLAEYCSASRDHAHQQRNQARSPRLRSSSEKFYDRTEDVITMKSQSPSETLQIMESDTEPLPSSEESANSDVESEHSATPDEPHHSEGTVTGALPLSPPASRVQMEESGDVPRRPLENGNILHHCFPEPIETYSGPSSCDSFTTANCLSGSSLGSPRTSTNILTRSQQSGLGSHERQHPFLRARSEEDHRLVTTAEQDCKNGQEQKDGEQLSRESSLSSREPSPTLRTCDNMFTESQGVRSPEASQERGSNHGVESEERLARLHTRTQQSEREEKQDLSHWLSSTLKAWLPDFKKDQEITQGTIKLKSSRRDWTNSFEDYDVRNVLVTERPNLWTTKQECPASGANACPHSCVSSLCNFRGTLESWKNQLLAMHAALDASSAAISQSPCTLCHEDLHSGRTHDCYTMRLVHKFWRMALQFKRSHLESSVCPRISQNISGQASQAADGREEEQCALGHTHYCSSDYSGCSQLENACASDELLKAPCAHVLLNDVDMLLDMLENLKQSSSSGNSRMDQSEKDQNARASESTKHQADAALSCCYRNCRSSCRSLCPKCRSAASSTPAMSSRLTSDYNPNDEHGRYSEDKSTLSLPSPSPSISLAEELGYLDDLADSTQDEDEDDDGDENRAMEAEQVSAKVKSSDTVLDTGPLHLTPRMRLPNASLFHAPSDSKLLQLSAFSDQMSELAEQRGVVSAEEVAVHRTKTLGKFALRYLEHIEKQLGNEDTSSRNLTTSFFRPTSGGYSQTSLTGEVRASSKQFVSASDVGTSIAPVERRDLLPLNCSRASGTEVGEKDNDHWPFSDNAPVDISVDYDTNQDDSKITKGNSSQRSGALYNEPSVIASFEEVIVNLNKLQSGLSIGSFQEDQCSRNSKNVQFILSSSPRNHSLTNAPPSQVNSPPLPLELPASSSCNSLTTSCSNVDQKHLSVTQAFDQLDKIVDELLELMETRLR